MIWNIIVVFVVILDQIVKNIIVNNVNINGLEIIDNFFYINRVENKGAAWSILQNERYFFIVATIITSLLIIYFLYKTNKKFVKISLSFILGGSLGNLIDRVVKGSVTDFLEFHFGSYIFPVFNIADTFIVIGTFMLVGYLWFFDKKEEK